MILIKLDQHVNEMMTTAGQKFQNFLWSRFLIIVKNFNMVTNGKRNSRLNPSVRVVLHRELTHGSRVRTQSRRTVLQMKLRGQTVSLI